MTESKGMTLIVKTITRISVWLIIMYGMYIILHGHLTPGGGFAGGVIIALAFLNYLLAYGRVKTEKWLNINFLHDMESASAIMFLIVGIIGIALSGSFLANWISGGELFRLFSSGTIPILNIIIGLKVCAGLFFVVWTLAIFHIEEETD
jgi:multisubunit Na+/H+ antiporter MnhB subunit